MRAIERYHRNAAIKRAEKAAEKAEKDAEKAAEKAAAWRAQMARSAYKAERKKENAWLVSDSDLLKRCRAVLRDIKEATSEDDRKLATAFTQLPTRQKFPAYYATIMHPVDIMSIESALASSTRPGGKHAKKLCVASKALGYDVFGFSIDAAALIQNALIFNEDGSQVSADALALKNVLIKAMQREFPGVPLPRDIYDPDDVEIMRRWHMAVRTILAHSESRVLSEELWRLWTNAEGVDVVADYMGGVSYVSEAGADAVLPILHLQAAAAIVGAAVENTLYKEFAAPVDPEKDSSLRRYLKVIKTPMDLKTIAEKCAQQVYDDVFELSMEMSSNMSLKLTLNVSVT